MLNLLLVLSILLPIALACVWRGMKLEGKTLRIAMLCTVAGSAVLAAVNAVIPNAGEIALGWTDMLALSLRVDGLSRVASHQLVRHRVASFSQQSQRYVKMDGTETAVMPPTVASLPEAAALFQDQVQSAHEAYKKLITLGVPAEDARFIL